MFASSIPYAKVCLLGTEKCFSNVYSETNEKNNFPIISVLRIYTQ